jgi:hypothetical protein
VAREAGMGSGKNSIRRAFGQQARLLEAADGREVIILALYERPDLVNPEQCGHSG